MLDFVFLSFSRFVWNFFRLENEHLNNCGQFRAVRDISVVPAKRRGTDISEEAEEVVTAMDEDNGIENIRRRKSTHSNTSVQFSEDIDTFPNSED